jgi:hypothetical protein
MSRKSELSAKVFAVYLFFIGVVFVVAPNMLLAIFRIPQTSEVWIHVVGVLVFNIGVYAWVSAKHEAFLVASIYTRFLVFAVFATFAVIGLSSPMLALFGVVDLLGGIWTHFALKAEASARLSLTTHTNVTESAADLTTVSDLARRSTHTRDLLPEL